MQAARWEVRGQSQRLRLTFPSMLEIKNNNKGDS